MAPGCIEYPGRPVRYGGPADQCREDICYGLLPMSDSGEPVGGGVKVTDEGRGPFLPGVAEWMGAV